MISMVDETQGKISPISRHKKLPSPVGICRMESAGYLLTDSQLEKIFIYREQDNRLGILNENLVLKRPTGICFLAARGEIWVVETLLHRITILNKAGEMLRTIGKRGTAAGEFNFPTHIWADKSGTVYVVDAMNFRVQIFSAEGEYLSSFGQPGDASGYFARPRGIATDSFGNIYVVDALFHAVQIFDAKGNYLSHFGEQGREAGQFWLPAGIYIDENNYVYVADSFNGRIQVFQLVRGGPGEN
ncbi:MAG: 6-bladed beta-propeller [Calditrichia bacterium]